MDWGKLNFTGKDVILICGYLISGVWFVSGISNTMDRYGDRLQSMEIKINEKEADSKTIIKENVAEIGALKVDLNLAKQQILLNKQELENIKLLINKK